MTTIAAIWKDDTCGAMCADGGDFIESKGAPLLVSVAARRIVEFKPTPPSSAFAVGVAGDSNMAEAVRQMAQPGEMLAKSGPAPGPQQFADGLLDHLANFRNGTAYTTDNLSNPLANEFLMLACDGVYVMDGELNLRGPMRYWAVGGGAPVALGALVAMESEMARGSDAYEISARAVAAAAVVHGPTQQPRAWWRLRGTGVGELRNLPKSGQYRHPSEL